MSVDLNRISLTPSYTLLLTTLSYYLFLLPVIFLCCLRLPYVYREPPEPASINRVLILDRPFSGVSCRSARSVVDKSLPTWITHNKDIKSSNTITNYFVQYYSPRSQQKKSKSKVPGIYVQIERGRSKPSKSRRSPGRSSSTCISQGKEKPNSLPPSIFYPFAPILTPPNPTLKDRTENSYPK